MATKKNRLFAHQNEDGIFEYEVVCIVTGEPLQAGTAHGISELNKVAKYFDASKHIKFCHKKHLKSTKEKQKRLEQETNGWTLEKLSDFRGVLSKVRKCIKELEQVPGGFIMKIRYDYNLGRAMEDLDKVHNEYLEGLKNVLKNGEEVFEKVEAIRAKIWGK